MSAIYKKEMRTYFNSMTGYIFIGVFVFVTALYFSLYNIISLSPDFRIVLSSIIMVLLLIIPILTMGLLSQEAKQKTDQLLLTSPVNVYDIVIGKFLASISLFLISLLVTFIFPIIISFFGNVVFSEVICAYLGFLFMGICFISVGIWISSLSDNQIISAVLTFMAMFVLFFIEGIATSLPEGNLYGIAIAIILCVLVGLFVYYSIEDIKYSLISAVCIAVIFGIVYFVKPDFYNTFLYDFVMSFSMISRFSNFILGIFDISSIIFYVSFSAFFIYLTVRSIEKKRWN